jgi:hypothetical protein
MRELWHGCNYGMHAEMNALVRLQNYFQVKAKKKTVNLLVIRINMRGELKYSKPCIKCISFLNTNMKCFKIKNVYYSCDDGSLTKVKFTTLCNEKNQHVSKRFKNKNVRM